MSRSPKLIHIRSPNPILKDVASGTPIWKDFGCTKCTFVVVIMKIVYQSCLWAKCHLSPQLEDCVCLWHLKYSPFKIKNKYEKTHVLLHLRVFFVCCTEHEPNSDFPVLLHTFYNIFNFRFLWHFNLILLMLKKYTLFLHTKFVTSNTTLIVVSVAWATDIHSLIRSLSPNWGCGMFEKSRQLENQWGF